MQLTKRLFVAALTVLVAITNVDAANGNLEAKVVGQRSFTISANNVVGDTRLEIRDMKGVVLYDATIDHAGSFARNFNVSNLPVGDYELIILDEFKTQTMNLLIDRGDSINIGEVETQLNPIISKLNDNVVVSMNAFEKEELKVFIYDINGNQIQKSTIIGTGYIGQKFDLESLEAGSYQIIVQHGRRSFSKSFNI